MKGKKREFKAKKDAKAKKRRKTTRGRRLSLWSALTLGILFVLLCAVGDWYVHHSRKWLETAEDRYPSLVTALLEHFGDPTADITDALNLTGHDCVYEYDTEAPQGEVLFAGAPVRTGSPAPRDIEVLDRGEFKVGWSPSLRHPVWVAYHVVPEERFTPGKRPSFAKDSAAPRCPAASAYERSGYDRGHMAPNYAIASRYGEAAQKRTFLMSNISPQRPALNRGVWRQVEHRIANYWTRRYGEIWVIVGAISAYSLDVALPGTDIDVPVAFYQIIVAQEGMDVRALAVVYGQNSRWDLWPSRGIVSIDDLEKMTGLDFLAELPSFIQDPLEAELPSRLWPVSLGDVLPQLWMRYCR